MNNDLQKHYTWQPEFEEISSYPDANIGSIIKDIKSNPVLRNILDGFKLKGSLVSHWDKWDRELDSICSIHAFQDWIADSIYPELEQTINSLSVEGLQSLDPEQSYIFISNHRDIVMDPLLLNLTLKKNGFSVAHCAIGDNLLLSPIADQLARLNHCFKVIRSLTSPKAILKAMRIQSAYIGYRRFVHNENIWIAQREGRAKDNLDKTNPALIKMLALSRPKDIPIGQFYNNLNIVPVCYSYEWDPCDIDKANQLHAIETQENYKKESSEDLKAVKKGLLGKKGNIAIRFGQPIRDDKENLTHLGIAETIDNFIANNYQAYPVNYAASELLGNSTILPDHLSVTDIDEAKSLLTERLIELNSDVRRRVLNAYSLNLK